MEHMRNFEQRNDMSISKFLKFLWLLWVKYPGKDQRAGGRGWISLSGGEMMVPQTERWHLRMETEHGFRRLNEKRGFDSRGREGF